MVLHEEVPDDANILGARFGLALKDIERQEKPVLKACFVEQGH